MKDETSLTIFSCPKPFRGHIKIIQRNAIKSWTLLQPKPEIILIGNEWGTAELCKEFRLRHIPNMERNEYGTPLVNSIFTEAEKASSCNLMCYVNADIILMNDFMLAVQRALKLMPRFMIIGRRWDVDIKEQIDFSGDWERDLNFLVTSRGKLHGRWGMDFFVFSKGLFGEIPPFAIGRWSWDNWLVYKACSKKIPVVDITLAATVIHQNHKYVYKVESICVKEESERNLDLLGWHEYGFSVFNATHKLTPNGLKRNSILFHLVSETDRHIRMISKFIRVKLMNIFHS